MSEALRPSWKLAASILPWFCKRRLEERARSIPAGADGSGPILEASSDERSPTVVERAGSGFEEDFRQLSEEAPSDGLTTIPERGWHVINNQILALSHSFYPNNNISLTRWIALVESSGDLCKRVPSGGGVEQMGQLDLQPPLFLVQVMRSNLLTYGGLQQAVGGDGSVPQEPVQAGLHRAHHTLRKGGRHSH